MPSLESYTVVLRPDDNGTFVAYVPAIEGCHAWGQTQKEARIELVNVFEMIRDEYREEGRWRSLFKGESLSYVPLVS